jgi:hypothetical protein
MIEYTACMQYTLRNVPRQLDEELRRRARLEGKSLNLVVIEALLSACGLQGEPTQQRDLSDIAGSWQEDSELPAILEELRRIDPEDWVAKDWTPEGPGPGDRS